MGCSKSKIDAYMYEPLLENWKNDFEVLGFVDDDISFLYGKISGNAACDVKRMDIDRIMEKIGVSSRLLRKVFEQVDSTRSGYVSFKDAIVVIWYLCTVENEDLTEFVFDLYDEDGNLKMDYEEYTDMLEGIWKSKTAPRGEFQDLQSKIQRQKQLGNTGVSRSFFIEYCGKHPSIMEPVQRLQHSLRKKCLGVEKWGVLIKVKDILFDYDYIPLSTFERGFRKGHYGTVGSTNNSVDDQSRVPSNRSRRNSVNRRRDSTSSAVSLSGRGTDGGVGLAGAKAGGAAKIRRQLSTDSVGTNGSSKSKGRRRSLGILDIPPALELPPPSSSSSPGIASLTKRHSSSCLTHYKDNAPEDQDSTKGENTTSNSSKKHVTTREKGVVGEEDGAVFVSLNSKNLSKLSVTYVKK